MQHHRHWQRQSRVPIKSNIACGLSGAPASALPSAVCPLPLPRLDHHRIVSSIIAKMKTSHVQLIWYSSPHIAVCCHRMACENVQGFKDAALLCIIHTNNIACVYLYIYICASVCVCVFGAGAGAIGLPLVAHKTIA